MNVQKAHTGFLSKILLALIVVTFGVFDASVFGTSAVYSSPQIELAFDNIQTADSYEVGITSTYATTKTFDNSAFIFCSRYLANYNTATNVKYQSVSKKHISFMSISYLAQLIRIPEHSEDLFKS